MKANNGRQSAKPAQTQRDPLIGKFFHSLEANKIAWQGEILGSPQPGWYLRQLFEWLGGQPSMQRLVPFAELKSWLSYDSSEQMVFSYDYGSASSFSAKFRAKHERAAEDNQPVDNGSLLASEAEHTDNTAQKDD
jgi:hypothetical protein